MNHTTTVSLGLALALGFLAGCATEGADPPVADDATGSVVSDLPLDVQFEQAVGAGDAALAASLIDLGLDVNALLPNGIPPIHYAAQMDQVAIITDLVEAGASLELIDREGRTPLMVAAGFARTEAIQVIIDGGVDIGVANAAFFDNQAWHYAARYGNVPALALLLDAGVDINTLDSYDNTALHVAAYNNHLEATQWAIDHGVDVNARDAGGSTARGWAEYHGDLEVAAAIEAAGGEV